MLARIKGVARRIKADLAALWLASRDGRTPAAAKIFAAITVAYALSPIDLIPDFIPVLGLLDDLLLVPAGIWLAIRLIPPELMDQFRRAAQSAQPGPSAWGAIMVAAAWALVAAAVGWRFFA
ncbi:DUF1232 domain-containing protein [Altererythrobacter confluentis]|uniref:DUF1232 domain-containing protein n=2 Tax=Allopontixanthobacter confluentis TaxID=1849021 RepID=A0A6L7GF49_9SPHN|nr:DUF1232 domain-containing protein [Allopontixanthobacter confluentis]MXP13678.1 DUF1232 domain-containing protein [Allopontixanthobacter confluentis]